MIITEASAVDNSDTASIVTLVSRERDRTPRFFAGLIYASLVVSVFPFIFSLLNVVTTKIFSVPSMLAYVFTTPFHVGALLVIWQYKRQIDMQLPFSITSWRNMVHLFFLILMWVFSATTSGMGAERFVRKRMCWDENADMLIPCSQHNYTRTAIAFIGATLLSVVEALVLAAILIVCFRSRPRKPVQNPIPLTRTPSPKVISV